MSDKKNIFDPTLKTLLEKRFAFFMSPLEFFIHKQTTSSLLLIIFAVISMFIANSPWSPLSQEVSNTELGLILRNRHFSLALGEWISQGLMALFFFLAGLEIKREILAGKLKHFHEISLIIFAALGGIIMPALFYSFLNYNGPGQHGWGIPTATDTAFAVGILALMARRVSVGMTVFLMALSILDDIGAVFVISVFYAKPLNMQALGMAFLMLILLFSVNRLGIRNGWIYAVMGIALWVLVYKSGIHATCAGLLLAVMIPARASISPLGFIHNVQNLIQKFKKKHDKSVKMLGSPGQHSIVSDISKNVQAASTPLQRWEISMITPITVIILPIFALFNVGFPLNGDIFMQGIRSPVTLGIITGLVVGKPLGVLLFTLAGLKLKIGKLPEGVTLNEIIGIALLAGIGFTMSIFFATLSFASDKDLLESARLGILIASLMSALIGSVWTYWKVSVPSHVTR